MITEEQRKKNREYKRSERKRKRDQKQTFVGGWVPIGMKKVVLEVIEALQGANSTPG